MTFGRRRRRRQVYTYAHNNTLEIRTHTTSYIYIIVYSVCYTHRTRKVSDRDTRPLVLSIAAHRKRDRSGPRRYVEIENTRPGRSPVIMYTHQRHSTHTRARRLYTWHIPGGNVRKCIHVIWSDGLTPTHQRVPEPICRRTASFGRARSSVRVRDPIRRCVVRSSNRETYFLTNIYVVY